MKALGAIWPCTLDPSSSPAEGTVLARFAGKVGPKPLVPVPISAALLTLPTEPHIPASHSYSDMISLEKHGMNFSQRVINHRRGILVYKQRADDSPREGRNVGRFLTTGSTPRVSTVGDNWVMHRALARGSSSQSCIHRAIRKRNRRSTGSGANGMDR